MATSFNHTRHLGNNVLLNTLFKRLYFHGSESCASLSHWLKKSIPSVTKELNILIEKDCVVTNGLAPSTGGRRATQYSLSPDFGYIVAVAMDQLFTTIVIYNLNHQQITEEETFELELHETIKALPYLCKKINEHIKRSALSVDKILGVGIAMPGFVNKEKGHNYTFFNQHLPISHKDFLEKELRLPVFMDNDSSLTALAEWTFGQANGANNAMIINIGWGTGLGMIVNGKMFRGETGYAGEFSHIPVSDNGVLCECGKRGCLETETSLLIMAQKAIDEINKGGNPGIELKDIKYMSEVVIEGALKGNQFCIDLLSQIGLALGKGIAILIHIMNPGIIVLSGRGAKAKKILMAPIQQALNQYCIPRMEKHTKITISKFDHEAPLIGAAALVIENYQLNIKQQKVSA